MALKTTNTATFNLDVNEIIEEAFERCGQELRSGYDFRTARRSLNLMLMEWANRVLTCGLLKRGRSLSWRAPLPTTSRLTPLTCWTL